jgi:hypothetical protein
MAFEINIYHDKIIILWKGGEKMHIRKSVLAALLMTIATSATIGVYAMTNYSNIISSSSNVSTPSLSIQWINQPPATAMIGETWVASIQLTNNNNIVLSGFSLVFNVTAPVLNSGAVTLSVLYGETSYFSSSYGSTMYSSNIVQYTYSGLVIPAGISTVFIRGRYNAAGSYSWKVAIASGSSSSY